MKYLIVFTLMSFSLLSYTQNKKMIIIGESDLKAKNAVKRLSDQDKDFIFEEYHGSYDGFDDKVSQYSIWGSDNFLFESVFVIDDKVVLHIILADNPTKSVEELSEVRDKIRKDKTDPDVVFVGNNIYKVNMNEFHYFFRKHFILYMPGKEKKVMYIVDSSNKEYLNNYTKLFEEESKKKGMKVFYL